MTAARFVLHHSPRTRSASIHWLLEEAGVPFEIVHHSLERGTHKAPEFLAINPHGKLPALVDRGPDGTWSAVVTESGAICAYVADLVSEAKLAPAIGTPERAAYAFWMAYRPGVIEPALMDMMFPRQDTPEPRMVGWPPFAEALDRIEQTLAAGGPWLLGSQFTAADIMVGSMLHWLHAWGKLPHRPSVARYIEAIAARPALKRCEERDAKAAA